MLRLRLGEAALRANAPAEVQAVTDTALAFRRRVLPTSSSARPAGDLLVLIQLRGGGDVELEQSSLASLPPDLAWQLTLSTEELSYALDAAPVTVETNPFRVSFRRPGAVILRAEKREPQGAV
jgi:hypothetical protein